MNKRHLEKTVRWILYVMLMVTVLTAFIALVDKRTGSETPAADAPVSEAPVGSFESTAFNEGWVMTEGGKDRTITLPYREASIHSKDLPCPSILHTGQWNCLLRLLPLISMRFRTKDIIGPIPSLSRCLRCRLLST